MQPVTPARKEELHLGSSPSSGETPQYHHPWPDSAQLHGDGKCKEYSEGKDTEKPRLFSSAGHTAHVHSEQLNHEGLPRVPAIVG